MYTKTYKIIAENNDNNYLEFLNERNQKLVIPGNERGILHQLIKYK